ncbi:MAG: radical SAM protein, partial [Deltaproteobacteria bacterium]|nr:radical SAM protein [Deltaproteobacteria bacterium]
DAERTRSFLSEHAGKIGFLNLSILNLPRDAAWPGQPSESVSGEGEGSGGREPLGLYRPVPPRDGWGRAQARRFLRERLLGDPSIRAIAARTPPGFTSNHAFFFPPGASPGG